MHRARARVIAIVALALLAGRARAEQVLLSPGDDVEGTVNAAQPGDELVLAGGTYELTERFGITLSGTADAPIVIRAADGERPIFHRAGQDQNVIDVDQARYVVFRGLEIAGGSHGLRLIDVSFVTVEDCEIHDTGDVALSANSGDRYEALHIVHNDIHHTHGTGEGMYLGCNDNGCQVFDSVIEGNHVHDTNDASIEQGDGIELKEGSYNNVIRDNVIHDTHYPCILTYSTRGNGDPNVIERNLLWHCGDNGIQSAADAVIRNNIILSANGNGIALQPHQAGTPDDLTVMNNTVLAPNNDALSVSGLSGTLLIVSNALYAAGGNAIRVAGDLTLLATVGNVVQGAVEGPSGGFVQGGTLEQDFVAASFSGAPPLDVFPAVGSALIGSGDAAHVTEVDFNGTLRNDVPDVGAYAFDADGNPGWTLGPSFKDAAAAGAPSADAGVPEAGASGDSGTGGSGSAAGGSGGNGSASAGSGGRTGASGGGSGRGGAGPTAGASAHPGAAGEDASPSSSSDGGGCACRIARRGTPPHGLYLALLVGALVRARRSRAPRA